MDLNKKFILGTAQFGFNYGIANFDGIIKKNDANSIIKFMKKKNMKILDTASSYHDSEKRLGELGVHEFDIITKYPFRDINTDNLESWIEFEIKQSLQKLKIEKLYAILIHDFDYINDEKLPIIHNALSKLKNKYFSKIGISTYSIEKSLKKIRIFPTDIIQTNYNAFDTRIDDLKIKHLFKNKIEIHARSIFLQGLLINKNNKNEFYFKKFQKHLDFWFNFLKINNFDPIDYCIQFAISNSAIDKVVLGVDNFIQFQRLLNYKSCKSFKKFKSIQPIPNALFNPSLWSIE